jgi:hypothetical protein
MFDHRCRWFFWCPLLVLLAAQVACATSPAPKVECDSNLRPINPGLTEHQRP